MTERFYAYTSNPVHTAGKTAQNEAAAAQSTMKLQNKTEQPHLQVLQCSKTDKMQNVKEALLFNRNNKN